MRDLTNNKLKSKNYNKYQQTKNDLENNSIINKNKNDNDFKDENKNNSFININKNNRNKRKKNNNNNTNNNSQGISKNRILCFNMLNSGECSYSFKCLYAHSLNEQYINNDRKKALDLLNGHYDLTDIDLINNTELQENLSALTKMCDNCIVKVCPGGYNCKFGACHKNVLICNADFQKGDCKNFIENGKCINGFHLTLRNLVPYIKQQLLHDFPNEYFLKDNINSNLFPYNDEEKNKNTQDDKSNSDIKQENKKNNSNENNTNVKNWASIVTNKQDKNKNENEKKIQQEVQIVQSPKDISQPVQNASTIEQSIDKCVNHLEQSMIKPVTHNEDIELFNENEKRKSKSISGYRSLKSILNLSNKVQYSYNIKNLSCPNFIDGKLIDMFDENSCSSDDLCDIGEIDDLSTE